MTKYPAYRHGLTIEVRDGRHVVTNGFGGSIVYSLCDGLEDALDMRERYAIGFPAEAVALVGAMDAVKNRIYDAEQAIEAETGERPYRVPGHVPSLIVYATAEFLGEAYSDEPAAHAVALERLLDAVLAAVPVLVAAE